MEEETVAVEAEEVQEERTEKTEETTEEKTESIRLRVLKLKASRERTGLAQEAAEVTDQEATELKEVTDLTEAAQEAVEEEAAALTSLLLRPLRTVQPDSQEEEVTPNSTLMTSQPFKYISSRVLHVRVFVC